ncbi:MAG: hypothetical protein PHU73_01465, partial [Patescibacteria group bacterium]|nr:hypothetical protein [Patescibacteria group bacterium]
MKINKKGLSTLAGILIAVIALLVIANVATVYYFYAKNKEVKISQVTPELVNNERIKEVATTTLEDNILGENEIAVDWQLNSRPKVTLKEFLPQTMLSQSSTNGLSDDYLNNTEYGGAVYLGKIKNGLFEGKDLYRIEI